MLQVFDMAGNQSKVKSGKATIKIEPSTPECRPKTPTPGCVTMNRWHSVRFCKPKTNSA